jgi:hypothetical protein
LPQDLEHFFILHQSVPSTVAAESSRCSPWRSDHRSNDRATMSVRFRINAAGACDPADRPPNSCAQFCMQGYEPPRKPGDRFATTEVAPEGALDDEDFQRAVQRVSVFDCPLDMIKTCPALPGSTPASPAPASRPPARSAARC